MSTRDNEVRKRDSEKLKPLIPLKTLRLLALANALLLFHPEVLHAALDPGRILTQYTQKVFSTEAGLPHNSVTAMAQTRDGYLWIGTEEGLARFDGVRFTIFDKQNTAGFPGNQISALAVDADDSLWIGTAGNGLIRYIRGQFRTFTTRDGLSSDTISSLYSDKKGTLWIGTDGQGLNRFQHEKIRRLDTSDALSHDTVFAITGGNDGRIWFGTPAGLTSLENGKFTTYTKADGLVEDYVKTVMVDHLGAVWAGTNRGGVSRFQDHQFTSFRKQEGLPSNSISALYEDSLGTVWVGTIDGGLSRYRDSQFTNYAAKDGLPSDRVFSLHEDRQGGLWIGTGGAGLVSLQNGLFTITSSREGLSSSVALPIFQDHEGAIWIGTNGGGLNRLKNGRVSTFTTRNGLSGDIVLAIAEDRENTLWVSTRKGLNRIKNDKVTNLAAGSGLPGDIVLCLYRDREGVLWAGSRGGLSRYDGERFRTYTTVDGLSSNYVLSLYEDADRTLWIGTGNGGLNRLKDGRFSAFTTSSGLSSNAVWCLAGEADGTLWVGTSGGGLNRLKDGKFKTFATKDGLDDDQLFRLFSDRSGYLWMSSNRGIARVSKKLLNAYADGHAAKVVVDTYGPADGLRNRECNGGFQPAGWQTTDGHLLFPTMDGVAAIDPEQMSRQKISSPVTIERIAVDGKLFNVSEKVRADPGKGQLQFEFTAPNLTEPHKLQFKYRLEGFDKEWVDAGERRTAYYTNIPAGEYVFRVIAGTLDAGWHEQGAAASVELLPHFYQKMPFILLCVLLVLATGVGGYRLRIERLRSNERRLVRLVDERTKELQEEVAAKERAHADLAAAQQTLIELSRRSGMAEIATGVLHNVGNVLNSVNVAAGVVSGKVRELRLEQLEASVKLLERNLPELQNFVTDDPKGQRVIPYMAKLASHLQGERQLVLTELEGLNGHIDHIKQIVAFQQAHAKVSALTEMLSLQSLIEDAIKLVELVPNGLKVLRDFADVPEVRTAKHKFLQILVNLLGNAKHAVLDHNCPVQEIRVCLKLVDSERVQIEVHDSGVGIAKENLTRIFAHGFTTKPNGHGFGLHSGALAAREMGGSLRAESQGIGFGATFILELPLQEQSETANRDAA